MKVRRNEEDVGKEKDGPNKRKQNKMKKEREAEDEYT